MSDFFREVDEDYRRDRLVKLWTRHQWLFIAAAVAIVAATAGVRIYQNVRAQGAEAAGERYQAALQLADEGKSAEAEAAFEALARTGPKGYATLSRLRAADAIAARDPAAGAAAFEALAGDAAYEPAFRDMATIRAAILRVDSDDPKVFAQKYGALAGQSFTYRNSMRELLALAAFRAGDFEAAGQSLDLIIADPAAPSALRQRAEAFSGLVQAAKPPPAALQPAAPPPASPPSPEPSAAAVPPK